MLWDSYAPRYDQHIRVSERLLFPGGRPWACGQASGRTLEVAVGTSLNLPYYRTGIVFTGIDLSPVMLAAARDRAGGLGLEAGTRLLRLVLAVTAVTNWPVNRTPPAGASKPWLLIELG